MRKFYLVLAFLCLVPAAQAVFTLGNGGKSAIVVADDAVISAKYAAKELAFYIEKALGTKLDILKESDAKQLFTSSAVKTTRNCSTPPRIASTSKPRWKPFMPMVSSVPPGAVRSMQHTVLSPIFSVSAGFGRGNSVPTSPVRKSSLSKLISSSTRLPDSKTANGVLKVPS